MQTIALANNKQRRSEIPRNEESKMSEAKFTKGPWKACQDGIGGWNVNCRGKYDNSYCDIGQNSPTVCDAWDLIYADCENKNPKANAHLIAAAPEMYELLDSIENDNNQLPKWLFKKIKVTLAKARGDHESSR
jgi:hypothetical protein